MKLSETQKRALKNLFLLDSIGSCQLGSYGKSTDLALIKRGLAIRQQLEIKERLLYPMFKDKLIITELGKRIYNEFYI